MTEYDDTNRGALFPAENQKIVRSGPVNINGKGEYCAIVQTITKNGKTVFEFYQKIGAIFPTEKRNENDADMSGNLETSSGQMKVWGRKKQSKNGNDYTHISLAPPLDKYPNDHARRQGFKEMNSANKHMESISARVEEIEDDEIPF